MNKKGFTLVELLAVIVILAIILVIVVPKTIEIINTAKLSSMEDTVKMLASSAEREYMTRTTLGTYDQENNPINCTDIVTLSGDNYDNCSITFSGTTAHISVDGKGKFDGLSCVDGTKYTPNCNKSVVVYKESILNGAYPRLTEGMIPVTIGNDGTVKVADKSLEWYSYENKQWANAVLVKESGTHTRSYYEDTIDATISEEDIIAYLVWIPRYRYTLWNVEGNEAIYESGVCTSYCPVSISITFEDASTTKSNGSTNGTQLTHPAFTFDGTELNGIWVGKFETTQGTSSNVGTTNPTIKPNISSWINQNVANRFLISIKMGTESVYGFTGESRISKNSDWGAIVYLSHSVYGIDNNVRVNYGIYTGCGAQEDVESSTLECEMAYGSGISSYPQSTTGNIYGIFDMSGGRDELQMGVVTDTSNNLYSGVCKYYMDSIGYNTGYNGKYGNLHYSAYCDQEITSNTEGISYPDNKYYKLYCTSNWSCYVVPESVWNWYSDPSNFGDALGEIHGWYGIYSSAPDTGNPTLWFNRGGAYYNPTSSLYSYSGMGGVFSDSYRIIVTTS